MNRHTSTRFTALALLAGAAFANTANAAVQIESVYADRVNNRILIDGQGFLTGLASGQQLYLGFAGSALAVDVSNDTHLEAPLPQAGLLHLCAANHARVKRFTDAAPFHRFIRNRLELSQDFDPGAF